MLFRHGTIYFTSGVNDKVAEDASFANLVLESLRRHLNGDWGDLCEEDKRENQLSLKQGFRLLSAYGEGGDKIWIITESDRSATIVLFPDEY